MITLTKDWQVVAQHTYNHSSGASVTFFIEAKYNEQDITTNETLTDIRLRSDLSDYSTLGGSNYNFTCSYCPNVVGGDVWWFADEIITSTTNTRILHNEDGTKQTTLTATIRNGYLGMNISFSGDITLPTIPRKSSVSCPSPFNIGDNVSINISSKSDEFTHAIKYSFEGSPLTTLVSGVKTTNKTYTYPWSTPPTMYTQGDMENKNSGTGYLIVETFSNGVSLGNSPQFNFTANVTNSNPTVDATIVDTNSRVVNNLTGNANILVKGLSNAKITATANTKNGATITSYRVTNGNQSSTTYPEDTINKIESDTFTFYVTDSRGNNNGVNGTQKKVTFKDYFPPYATTLEVRRTEQTSTEIIANLRGKWWNGNFGKVNNELQYSYRIKESSTTTWGAWSTVTRPTISGENFSVTNLSLGTAFDTGKDYDIQFRLNDVGGTYFLNNIQQVTKSIGIIDIYEDEVAIFGDGYIQNELIVGDLKCRNLFNKNLYSFNYIKSCDTGTNAYYYNVPIYVGKANTKYYLKTEYLNDYTCIGVSNLYVLVYPNEVGEWLSIGHTSAGKVNGILLSDELGYVYLRVFKTLSEVDYNNLMKNSNIQISEGTSDEPYTPYKAFDNTGYELYNNSTGSIGNITLNDSIGNYSRIKIFYKSNINGITEIENSHEYYSPNNKTIALMQTDYDSYPSLYHGTSYYTVSGNVLTFAKNLTTMIRENSTTRLWEDDTMIKITKVIGFK